ncbi:hypothetical protein V1504DRAFT_433349 [Lipomyces starkeyi]
MLRCRAQGDPAPSIGLSINLKVCVNDVKITLESQEVVVKTNGDVSYDAVLNQIKKSGKEVRSGEVIA